MNLEELLESLGINSPEEFQYFEDMAELVEGEKTIYPEAVYPFLKEVNLQVFSDLVSNYFDDMMEGIPDDAVTVYTLLDSIKMALIGLARNCDEDKDLVLLAEEFCRFRNWYSIDSEVWVQELGASGGSTQNLSLRDALTLSRVEKMGGDKHEYIFDDVMEFEMDQYTMSFADLAAEELAAEQAEEEQESEFKADFDTELDKAFNNALN